MRPSSDGCKQAHDYLGSDNEKNGGSHISFHSISKSGSKSRVHLSAAVCYQAPDQSQAAACGRPPPANVVPLTSSDAHVCHSTKFQMSDRSMPNLLLYYEGISHGRLPIGLL